MKVRRLCGAFVLGATLLTAADVLAANVDSPTPPVAIEIDFPIHTGTLLYFGRYQTTDYVLPFGGQQGFAGYVQGTIEDSSGAFTYCGSGCADLGAATDIPSLFAGGNQVKGKLVVTDAFGPIDAKGGAVNPLRFTLRLRVKFTGASITGTCQTNTFDVTVGTDKSTSWTSGWTGVPYNNTAGTFSAVAQDFGAIPALTTAQITSCNGGNSSVGSDINMYLQLGTNASAALQFAGSGSSYTKFSPVLSGS